MALNKFLLNDGVSFINLNDGVSDLLLNDESEDNAVVAGGIVLIAVTNEMVGY